MNSLDRIVANEGWRTPRRFALTLAAVFLVVYIAFVVVGSSLQGKLGVPLAMGWFQQFAAIGAAMIFAAMLGEPRTQLGLRAPTSGWVLTASIAAAAIVVGGFLASLALPYEPTRYSLEYFAYDATLPGLGEEFGLRGPWLALVLVGVAQQRWLRRVPAWVVLGAAAVPFAALHILESSGVRLVVMFGFTLFAGVVLQWARLRNGSIWTAVAAHNVANVVSSVIDMMIHAKK